MTVIDIKKNTIDRKSVTLKKLFHQFMRTL